MTTHTLVLILIAVAAVLVACVMMGPGSGEKAKARQKITDGALVIDVRSAGEYAGGHHPGARNIPVSEIAQRSGELGDKNRPIVVYCAAGMRAAKAKSVLLRAGFTDVTNAGGLSDLK